MCLWANSTLKIRKTGSGWCFLKISKHSLSFKSQWAALLFMLPTRNAFWDCFFCKAYLQFFLSMCWSKQQRVSKASSDLFQISSQWCLAGFSTEHFYLSKNDTKESGRAFKYLSWATFIVKPSCRWCQVQRLTHRKSGRQSGTFLFVTLLPVLQWESCCYPNFCLNILHLYVLSKVVSHYEMTGIE